jgi:hypothetical protein
MIHGRNAIAGFILFLATLVMADVVFFRIMPATYWVEYHAVEPEKTEYECNEEIHFVSTRTSKRDVFASWNDVFWCERNGIYEYTQSFQSSGFIEKNTITSGVWIYDEPTPCNTQCYLKSVTTIHLPYGIEKDQVVISGPFMIK